MCSVRESIADYINIRSEKMYTLLVRDPTQEGVYIPQEATKFLAAKGVNPNLAKEMLSKQDFKLTPKHVMVDMVMQRLKHSEGVGILSRHITLGLSLISTRRFFYNQQSVPYTFPHRIAGSKRLLLGPEKNPDWRHLINFSIKRSDISSYNQTKVKPSQESCDQNNEVSESSISDESDGEVDDFIEPWDRAYKNKICDEGLEGTDSDDINSEDDYNEPPPKKKRHCSFIDYEAKCV